MKTSTELRVWLVPLPRSSVRSASCSAVSPCIKPVVPPPPPKPEVWAVVAATILTGIALGVFCFGLLYWARVNYSPRIYYRHVTLSMLGVPEVLGGLLLGILLFILIYPFMGVVVTFLCKILVTSIARVYEWPLVGRWHPNAFLLVASSWPVTIWTIPPLTIAWVMGTFYKFYWQ